MLILAAVLGILVYGMIAAMLGTIMPTFRLTDDQNGQIAFAQAIGLVIASLSAGPLIDNKGKKVAMILALALIAAALFALPSTGGDYTLIRICLFVQGFGGGVLVTAANALASDIDESKRASTLNFLNLFFGLGGLATPFIAGNLLNGDAVRLCYLTAALTAATLLVNIVSPIPGPSGERGFKLSEAGSLVSSPALGLLAVFLFLYVACEVGVWNWLVKLLIERGVEERSALNILSLGFALGLLIGRVVVSRILMKIPPATVTLGSAGLMVVTTYLMLQTSSTEMAAVVVFCAGLAMAPVFPTTLAIVGDTFRRGTATAMGIVITFGWIGLAISSPIIGGIAASSSLNSALMLLPAASVLMVLVNLALRPFLAKKAIA
jgi:fucose permease